MLVDNMAQMKKGANEQTNILGFPLILMVVGNYSCMFKDHPSRNQLGA